MHFLRPIFIVALLVAATPAAHASPGEAAGWSPPALGPARVDAVPDSALEDSRVATVVVVGAAGPTTELKGSAEKPRRRPRAGRKPAKAHREACTDASAATVDPRLAQAMAQREQILGEARAMVAAGRPEPAARMLELAARAHADPVLLLAAATAELADHRLNERRLAEVIRLTQDTQRLIAAPIGLRVAPAEGPELSAIAKDLTQYAMKRQALLRQARRGKAQLACGASFMVLSAAGAGMAASGAVLAARVESTRGAYVGQDGSYLEALDSTDERADTLLTVGLVSSIAGAAIGIPLIIAGSREIKRSRAGRGEAPSLHLHPGLMSFSIAGKF